MWYGSPSSVARSIASRVALLSSAWRSAWNAVEGLGELALFVAEQREKAVREIDPVFAEIPVPDAVVGPGQGELETLLDFAQLEFGALLRGGLVLELGQTHAQALDLGAQPFRLRRVATDAHVLDQRGGIRTHIESANPALEQRKLGFRRGRRAGESGAQTRRNASAAGAQWR